MDVIKNLTCHKPPRPFPMLVAFEPRKSECRGAQKNLHAHELPIARTLSPPGQKELFSALTVNPIGSTKTTN